MDLAARPLRHSRIPHLAVSLLAKRASPAPPPAAWPCRPWPRTVSFTARNEALGGHNSRKIALQSTRHRHASTSTRRTRRTPAPALAPTPTSTRAPTPTTPSPSNPSLASSTTRAGRSKTGYLTVTMSFATLLSLYISYHYTTYRNAVRASRTLDLPQNADVSSRWTDLTRDFDDEVDLSEKLMGLRRRRRNLVREARGQVLEVSVGTGRNMAFYDLRHVEGFVFNDQSAVMVGKAEDKWEALLAGMDVGMRERWRQRGVFVVGDAGVRGLVGRPVGGFDTVVQTMGVCSMVDPVGFLRELGRLVRQPGENVGMVGQEDRDPGGGDRGGRILLLEHGRSSYEVVNRYLDEGAKMHADHYGCWWNKDIGAVVRESGLVVERVKRYNFGTTWEIVLRPRPKE